MRMELYNGDCLDEENLKNLLKKRIFKKRPKKKGDTHTPRPGGCVPVKKNCLIFEKLFKNYILLKRNLFYNNNFEINVRFKFL